MKKKNIKSNEDRIIKELKQSNLQFFINYNQSHNIISTEDIVAYMYPYLTYNQFIDLLKYLGLVEEFNTSPHLRLKEPYGNKQKMYRIFGYIVDETIYRNDEVTQMVDIFWTQEGRHFIYKGLADLGIYPVLI
jgi:hypothetical protein